MRRFLPLAYIVKHKEFGRDASRQIILNTGLLAAYEVCHIAWTVGGVPIVFEVRLYVEWYSAA